MLGIVTSVLVRDHPACKTGSQVLGSIGRYVSLTGRDHVLPSERSCTLVLRLNSPFLSLIDSNRVLQIIMSDGSYDEWLIQDIDYDSDPRKVVITGRDLIYRLMLLGTIEEKNVVSGLPNYRFEAFDKTPEFIAQTYMVDKAVAAGENWLDIGDIDFTDPINFVIDGMTPLAVGVALTEFPGIQGEMRLRRNGTTNYLLDIVEEINGSLAAVDVRTRVALRHMKKNVNGQQHFTGLQVFGSSRDDGIPYTLGSAVLRVAAKNVGGSNRLQIEDPEYPGKPVILRNAMYNGVGLYRFGKSTDAVLDTYESTQEVRVLDSGVYTVGDEFFLRENATGTKRYDLLPRYQTGISIGSYWPANITGLAGNVATIDLPWSGSADPLNTDDAWNGWVAEAWDFRNTNIVTSLGWNQADRIFTFSALPSGIASGDLLLVTNVAVTGSKPWTPGQFPPLRVDAVDASNSRVTVSAMFDPTFTNWPTPTTFVFVNVSLWIRGAETRISDCSHNASSTSGTVTLTSTTGFATGKLLTTYRIVAAPYLTKLIDPAAVTQYGGVPMLGRIDVASSGAPTVGPSNRYMRLWPGTFGPPTGYTFGAFVKTVGARESDPDYVERGPYSARIYPKAGSKTQTAAFNAGTDTATLDNVDDLFPGDVLRYGQGTGNQEDLTILSINPTTKQVQHTANAAFTHTVPAPLVIEPGTIGHNPGGGTQVAMILPDTFMDTVTGDDIVCVLMRVRQEGGNGQQELEMDGVGADPPVVDTQGGWVTMVKVLQPAQQSLLTPKLLIRFVDGVIPVGYRVYMAWCAIVQVPFELDDADVFEFSGENRCLQAGLQKLSECAAPPGPWVLKLLDLARADSARWGTRELLVGRYLRVTHETLGVSLVTKRCRAVSFDYKRPQGTEVELALPSDDTLLTRSLSRATAGVVGVNIEVTSDGVTVSPSARVVQTPINFSPPVGSVPTPIVTTNNDLVLVP
jgi:hypothetical protein